MEKPDPYIQTVLDAIKDLEDHARANRAHKEQGLYSEAIPRIVAILKNIVNAIDYEPTDDPDDPDMKGALLPIRYQTARTLEDVLTGLFQANPKNETIAGTLMLLMEDLHGMNPEDIAEFLRHAKGEKEPPAEPPAEPTDEEKPPAKPQETAETTEQ